MTNQEDRAYVSRLIIKVLTDKICAREAILHFPENHNDKSIQAAYHALVHREADEDLRHRDLLYKLIIHCGACMTNRREILSRILIANKKGIAITNYGLVISYCVGILDRAVEIFKK